MITKIVNISILWPAANCKGFRTRWGFIFRVVFLSSPCSVELKLVIGSVAPPIDQLRYRAWPRTGHCPLFPFYQLLEQLLQPLVLLTSCMPACVRWRVLLIRPTLCILQLVWQVEQPWKTAFLSSISSACLNVWRCVATSSSWLYVLLLCYYCYLLLLLLHSLSLWLVVKIKMNE